MEAQSIISSIYDSGVSIAIRDAVWVIPTIQSIHILARAALIGSVLVTDLRLVGLLAVDTSPQAVASRYMPWIWSALAVLVCSGLVLVIGEPERTLLSPVFWSKMVLVVTATLLTFSFKRPLLRSDLHAPTSSWARATKPLAWASLIIWIAVIFCGRWIAYAQ